jgi:hypothetical protein
MARKAEHRTRPTYLQALGELGSLVLVIGSKRFELYAELVIGLLTTHSSLAKLLHQGFQSTCPIGILLALVRGALELLLQAVSGDFLDRRNLLLQLVNSLEELGLVVDKLLIDRALYEVSQCPSCLP